MIWQGRQKKTFEKKEKNKQEQQEKIDIPKRISTLLAKTDAKRQESVGKHFFFSSEWILWPENATEG